LNEKFYNHWQERKDYIGFIKQKKLQCVACVHYGKNQYKKIQ